MYIATRLVAADFDGKNPKLLMQEANFTPGQVQSAEQDHIIDWSPGVPNAYASLVGVSVATSRCCQPYATVTCTGAQ